jgi:protein arginine kinase activator
MGLGAAQEIDKNPGSLKCPVCGFTQADFKKTGRLGCSSCYAVFSEGLSGMLKNMHKGTEHTGKSPAAFRQVRLHGEKMKSLQDRLTQAVAAEEYERAADLRDQIRQIEAELQA